MSENVGKSQEDVENRPEIAEVNFRKGKVRQQEMDTPKGIVRQQAEAVGGTSGFGGDAPEEANGVLGFDGDAPEAIVGGKEADHGEL